MEANHLRTYPARPVVGVGAVILDGTRVVLVKRSHPPLQGEWSLPGGVVELGETLEEAVAREALEETGLVIDVGPVVEIFDRIERGTDGRIEYHYVIVDYCCRATTVEIRCGSDAAEARWVPIVDLQLYHLTDKANAVIRKALRMTGPDR